MDSDALKFKYDLQLHYRSFSFLPLPKASLIY